MSVFDVTSQTGLQNSATTVASSLLPKKHAKGTLPDLNGAVANTATAKATTGSGSTGSPTGTSTTASTGTITSNDFLTLLVSELKNQDPTQPTDPNAYISQLVGVNSLQQLISINQGITSLDTAVGPTKKV